MQFPVELARLREVPLDVDARLHVEARELGDWGAQGGVYARVEVEEVGGDELVGRCPQRCLNCVGVVWV